MKDNKLIAEFMGLEKGDTMTVVNGGNMHKAWQEQSFVKSGVMYSVSSLPYKHSWDWLMPVVSKCYEYSEVYNKYRTQICASLSGVIDIDDTYKAVVDFIKWYNEN